VPLLIHPVYDIRGKALESIPGGVAATSRRISAVSSQRGSGRVCLLIAAETRLPAAHRVVLRAYE
jgi:hypothetical protein